MSKRFHWMSLAAVTVVLLAVFVMPGYAAYDREILQAVHNGVPNVGSNRVVVAELTAGDW